MHAVKPYVCVMSDELVVCVCAYMSAFCTCVLRIGLLMLRVVVLAERAGTRIKTLMLRVFAHMDLGLLVRAVCACDRYE